MPKKTEEQLEAERMAIEAEIGSLRNSLASSYSPIGDWKIVKCYEAALLNHELPYNLEELTTARQQARNRINELQSQL